MAKNIAIISDDLILNEKIIKSLDLNYNIKSFTYGVQIISELEEFNPDLIIVDIISISKDFFDFMDMIKQSSELCDKKVLILSQNKKMDAVIGPTPKVRGYISKPVDFDELKVIIDKNVNGDNKLIMVIDDDTEFLDLIKIFLESNNYKVIAISDSRRAVDSVKANEPSLIIVDLMMPEKDGFEIMMELCENKKTADIPIIVISAMGFNKFSERGIISGYPEYISRDIPSDIIREMIENSLSGVFYCDSQKTKVLLADDQIELLSLVKESLEKAGFIVFSAVDGKEAVEKIYEFNPDIAVIDYDMPFKNGLEVAVEIKNNPVYSHIPIIIVTAKSERNAKIKGLMMGVDDYITKPVDTEELIARIRMIVKRNRQVLDTNPLSKLPGNPSIQSRVEKAIERKEKFAVLYIDLNNFKAYNDVYGFEAGDKVIKTLANILVKVVMPNASSFDFIGHIGGDDFIVLTTISKAEDIAKRIINNFNQISPSFYNETDRKNGFIITKDRLGNVTQFPLIGVAIGIVHNLYKQISSYAQVSHIGSELKKAAKASHSSAYVIDRRRE
ncbi:MAG: response regulator [Elusimicrobiota bacterium]